MSGKYTCTYCASEPNAGYIEMPDNGPIVPCPVCNGKQTSRENEFEMAVKQRAWHSKYIKAGTP